MVKDMRQFGLLSAVGLAEIQVEFIYCHWHPSAEVTLVPIGQATYVLF